MRVARPTRYILEMDARSLLTSARIAQGLTQAAVARRAGTSQATLSAYERGAKSPSLAVTERIIRALGYELDLTPRITFRELTGRGRTAYVPDRLWRLNPSDCFTPLTVPGPSRKPYDLTNRTDRYAAYVWLLEHGTPEQLLTHLDGALLIDGWPDLTANLHDDVRHAWAPLADSPLDEWLIAQLRDEERRRMVKPISPHARGRAIRRLAEHGLEAKDIRAVLRGRDHDPNQSRP